MTYDALSGGGEGWIEAEDPSKIAELGLVEAVERFDRQGASAALALAEREAEEVRREYPLDGWPTMPLSRYAIGDPAFRDTFGRMIEFGSRALGSFSGGSSRTQIIYRKRASQTWFFDPSYASVDEAWAALRAGFVQAFSLASAGRLSEIDDIDALRSGP